MKRRKRLPKFKSEREEADFWATHDLTDYLHEFEKVDFKLPASLRRRIKTRAATKKAVTFRLGMDQIAAAKAVASRKSVPYQTLMRMWIAERLAKELSN
jgi:predicted DNA binding CopG/RHH family protein